MAKKSILKKILAIMTVTCFLMSMLAVGASAGHGGGHGGHGGGGGDHGSGTETITATVNGDSDTTITLMESDDHTALTQGEYSNVSGSVSEDGSSVTITYTDNDGKTHEYTGNVSGGTITGLEITDTEPGFAGNTATNVTKPATVETGAEVKVPLFINVGDKIQIDTRTGEYLGRAK